MTKTGNPWLDIPLADYEAHMALPGVGQAPLLADVLAAALRELAPSSVAVLGCAGGNAFDRISPSTRVVAIDINPEYLERLRQRFAAALPRLEVIAADLVADDISTAPVDLVFAGLVFEYVDAGRALDRARELLLANGALVGVLQAPSATNPAVTPSPFTSLGKLANAMRLVAPSELAALAAERGFRQKSEQTLQASGGKELIVQRFHRVT